VTASLPILVDISEKNCKLTASNPTDKFFEYDTKNDLCFNIEDKSEVWVLSHNTVTYSNWQ
jgi:hypothetical protein